VTTRADRHVPARRPRQFPQSTELMDFAFDVDGTMYGATQTTLYRIDTATGWATPAVAFSGDIVLADGTRRVMGIHIAEDGTLFATDFVPASLGGSSLYRVDRATGVAARVAWLHLAQVHSAEMAPPTPAARVQRLAARVASYDLAHGPVRSLLAKLGAAAAAIADSRTDAACGALGAFRHQVQAVSVTWLSAAQATQLATDALWSWSSLSCGR
jgi:hypothetical protein